MQFYKGETISQENHDFQNLDNYDSNYLTAIGILEYKD